MSLNGGGTVTLGFELSANDLMSGVLDRANAAVSRLHEGILKLDAVSYRATHSLANVGTAIFTASRGFLEGAFKMAEAGAPFEAAMHDVERLSHATSEQMREMNEAVFSAKNTLLGFTATESAKALKDLALEGGNAHEALNLLEPALLLAGITGRSAESGAKQLGVTLRSFHIEAKDAGETVDRLATSASTFHVTAGEMQDSLGRVARGAQLVGASMTDAAITLGLMRSGLPTLGQASMAANMAFMRMGDAKVSAALKRIGVDTKDAHGALLPLPNVLGQLAEKTAKMTDAERASALGKAFGARSAGAMTAAIKELQKGITDSTGVVHKGADAVKYLYEQMQNSPGAARRMRDAMLDTFEGQEKVLKAAVESVRTGVSAPLASALKPVVGAVADGLAKAVEWFAHVDPPTKKFIAQAVLLAGVLTGVLGAAFVVLGGPATLAVLALTAAGAALFEAYRQNLDGFADWVNKTVGRVVLGFKALSSLFSRGGFSLELFQELQADPSLMNFALNLYVWVNRVKEWLGGMAEGFSKAVEKVDFAKLGEALERLASKFGLVTGAINPMANGAALTQAGENGRNFGAQLAKVVDAAVKLATTLVDLVGWVVDLADKLHLTTDPLGKLKFALELIVAVKILQGVNSINNALWSFGPGALQAASNIGKLAFSLGALAVGQGAAAVRGIASALGTLAPVAAPVLAITAAFVAWAVALDQIIKLKKELGEGGWDSMKKRLSHTFTSQADIDKEEEAKRRSDFDANQARFAADRAKNRAAPAPVAAFGPLLPPGERPFSVVTPFPAAAEAAGQAGAGGQTAGAMHVAADAMRSAAASAAAASNRPLQGKVLLDTGVLVGELRSADEADKARGGHPVAPPG